MTAILNNNTDVRHAFSSPEKLIDYLCQKNDLSRLKINDFIDFPQKYYTKFEIKKKSGGKRTITPPVQKLRNVQRTILDLLSLNVPTLPACVCGGRKSCSYITHAKNHCGKMMVMTLDIKSFFPSTTNAHILPSLKSFLPDNIAEVILRLCTKDDQLPQGSPTSMLLANLSFLGVDKQFRRHCGKNDLDYSRYVDDIAISGNFDFSNHKQLFKRLIESGQYIVAPRKTKIMKNHTAQIVTGIKVNTTPRPSSAYIAEFKQKVRLCKETSPTIVADMLGIDRKRFKQQLTSQMNFIRSLDVKLGNECKGLLYELWNDIKTRNTIVV